MAETVIVTRDGAETRIAPDPHLTAMEAIRDAGFDELLALCGGACSCATCHVYVEAADEGLTRPASQDEDDLLDSSTHRRANSRLSCQVAIGALAGARLTIAPED